MLVISSVKRDWYSSFLEKYAKENGISPIKYIDFLENLLSNAVYGKYASGYPRTIKVAKSPMELARGDFEPAYTFTLPGPILWHNIPIWEGKCSKELVVELGYRNGDKRFFSNYSFDEKDKAHGIVAGQTGVGKSVTLNSILMSMCFMYAPWELQIHMADPKIVEFQRYGRLHHIPHLHTIAATSDMGYVTSMLTTLIQDMKLTNAGITKANGAKKISEFEENTGLCIPRHLTVFDEYQIAIKNAGENKKEVLGSFEEAARLGRNVGYNLLLCSQDVDSNVAPILGNFQNRFCLKCDSKVSELVLGNGQAVQGRVGLIFANNNPNAHNYEDNQRFFVPLQRDEDFLELGRFLEDKGKATGFKTNTNFYDEQDIILEDRLKSMIASRPNNDCIVLGEPSFVSDDSEKYYLQMDYSDNCNIIVLSPSLKNQKRFFATMFYNALEDRKNKYGLHFFFIGDQSVTQDICNFDDYDFNAFNIRDISTDNKWISLTSNVIIKNLLLDIDESSFEYPVYDNITINAFLIKHLGPQMNTDLNKSRMFYLLHKMQNDSNLQRVFKYRTVDDPGAVRLIKTVFDLILALGNKYLHQKVIADDFRPLAIHVIGASKIQHLGRGIKSSDVTYLRNILNDANRVKIRFVFYCTNAEWLMDLKPCIHYAILDGAEKIASQVKCSDYPQDVPGVSAIAFDMYENKMKRFKKLALSEIEVF